jgi:uncharacterized membrane protein YkoI
MSNKIGRNTQRMGFFLNIVFALTVALTPMQVFGQGRTTGPMSPASAQKKALASHPGEVVGKPKLVMRKGASYYDVYIRSGQVRRHVLVHARNGKILTDATPRTRNARRIALTAYPGKVVAGPTRTRYQGKNVSSVTVQSGVVRRTLLVDTQTGNIMKTMTRHTK